MRRAAVALLVLISSLAAVPAAGAAAPTEWHSEQPVTAGVGVPVLLGKVGDVECWSANRCLLITGGNGGVPAGVFAYDGNGWYRYSTVCGGSEGRIAWAGPDEFWTIADQLPGEEANIGNTAGELLNRSLCHFENGEVVASYSEPLRQTTSYLRMDAAACQGPDDCWFGGERLKGVANTGAFHLHWDGSSLTAIPSLTQPEPALGDPGRAVFGFAFFQQQLYESVSVRGGDTPVNETEPALLHRVALGTGQPFEPIANPTPVTEVSAQGLEGMRFADNGSTLWALTGALESAPSATPRLWSLEAGSFHSVPLSGGILAAGVQVGGFAMEPGIGGAWASFAPRGSTTPARIARIEPNGTVDDEAQLPRTEEELSNKGTAGPIACPAVGQCWMATSKGWLFHLGSPPAEGPNNDPAMHRLITSRPCDDACRSGVGAGLPEDNSGAEPEKELFPEVEEYEPLPIREPRPHPIYTHLKQKVIGGSILQLTFDLHVKAHVQLIAKEKKKVVAKTARMTLNKGHHRIRLKLDPKHWPTHLSLEVHRVKTKRAAK